MADVISVSELNEYARRLMAQDPLLRYVRVRGEISGFKFHTSGHCYFTLKDDKCRVACAMFRQYASSLDFRPEDGMKVTVTCQASLYPRDGAFQLYVTSVKREGEGDLYRRFEELKRKLLAEGLFDAARKREIPYFPHTIGIATSESGAAVHDIIKVARRRDPNIDIVFAPCQVQGPEAPEDIARAIRLLNEDGKSEVLLVGRGGGSMEDLWCFNEEITVRAIASSRIPVISCVGHEVDVTIADLAADVRAATPSAAAELAVPMVSELEMRLGALMGRLSNALERGQAARRSRLDSLMNRGVMASPETTLIRTRRMRLDMAVTRMDLTVGNTLEKSVLRLEKAAQALRMMDPAGVLTRGYTLVRDKDGHILGSDGIRAGQDVDIVFAQAEASASIREVRHGKDQV